MVYNLYINQLYFNYKNKVEIHTNSFFVKYISHNILDVTFFFLNWRHLGNSLMVQYLGLGALTARGLDSLPGWGIKIPQAMQHSQKRNKNWRYLNLNFRYMMDTFLYLNMSHAICRHICTKKLLLYIWNSDLTGVLWFFCVCKNLATLERGKWIFIAISSWAILLFKGSV